jgi:hypothetical protein
VQQAVEDAESELKAWSGNKSKVEQKGAEQHIALLKTKLTHLESEKKRVRDVYYACISHCLD